MFTNIIARLRKENGDEAINEILCHSALKTLFNLYTVAPLFEEMPDGHIVDGKKEIPVEIKSRFPKIFDTITAFANGFSDLRPKSKDLDITFHIQIIRI